MSDILDWFKPPQPSQQEQPPTQDTPPQEQLPQEPPSLDTPQINEPITETASPSTDTPTQTQDTPTQESINKDFNGFHEEVFDNEKNDLEINDRYESEKEFQDEVVWKPTQIEEENFWVDDTYIPETDNTFNPDYSSYPDYDSNIDFNTNSGGTVVEDNKINVKPSTNWGIAEKDKGFGETLQASDKLGSQNVRTDMVANRKTLSTREVGFVQAEPKQLTTLNMLELPPPKIETQTILFPTILTLLAIVLVIYIKLSSKTYLKAREETDLLEEKEKLIEEFGYKDIDTEDLFKKEDMTIWLHSNLLVL